MFIKSEFNFIEINSDFKQDENPNSAKFTWISLLTLLYIEFPIDILCAF